MTDKEMLIYATAYRSLTKVAAETSNNSEDQKRFEIIDWLIEQAEKREYWMKQHRKRANELEDAYFKIQLIEKQLQQAQAKAERYKQALEFYADKENYRGYLTAGGWVKTPVNDDDGEIARKALEGEE